MTLTNVSGIRLDGVKKTTVERMARELVKSRAVFLDTETFAPGFNAQAIIDQYLLDQSAAGKKITAGTRKTAAKVAEEARGEICLDPHLGDIRLLQLADDRGNAYVIDALEEDLAPVFKAINLKPVAGQNLKFDLKFLMKHYPDYVPGEVFDTMLAHRIIKNREAPGYAPSDLQTVVAEYTGVWLAKEHGTSDWGGEISEDMFKYALGDVLHLNETVGKQIHLLNQYSVRESAPYWDGRLTDTISILEMKFLTVVAELELQGTPINIDALTVHANTLAEELATLVKPYEKKGINTHSAAQLMKYLISLGLSPSGTAYEDLVPLLPDKRIVALLRIKELQKELQLCMDYVDRAGTHPTRRIHANYNQLRGAAGRMSCSSPNMQQIPRKLKKMIYGPQKGWIVLKADYPAIEARIMGVISRDPKIISIFQSGHDMHNYTAMMVMGKDPKDPEERLKAKAVNFGFMFGMGAETFMQYAFVNYGVKVTLDEAQKLRDKYLTVFRGVKKLHDKHSEMLREVSRITIQTLLGRRVKVDKFTNANNYPIQGTAAEMIKTACLVFRTRVRKEKLHARIINIIHDEVVIECPTKEKAASSKALKYAMELAVNSIISDFSTTVEVEEAK